MKHRSSDEELKRIVEKSSCIRQVLNALGMKAAGGNYKTVKERIAKLGLDTAHFTGSAWNRGRHSSNQRPLEVYLSNQAFITSHKLKLRLITEHVKQHRCDCCGLSEWMNKSIPLELHHHDGNSKNNCLANLSLLCPNCHALTSNYRGKNVQRVETKRLLPKLDENQAG